MGYGWNFRKHEKTNELVQDRLCAKLKILMGKFFGLSLSKFLVDSHSEILVLAMEAPLN